MPIPLCADTKKEPCDLDRVAKQPHTDRPSARAGVRASSMAIALALFAGTISLAGAAWATPSTPAYPQPGQAPSATPTPPEPGTRAFRTELTRRQARLNALRDQLDALDSQLEMAAEASNAASEQLGAVQDRLAATRQSLGAATGALDSQQSLLETRIAAMYRDGELSSAEIVLGAKSIPDLLQRFDFIRTIASADAGLAEGLSAQRDQIASQEASLTAAEAEAQSLQMTLSAHKAEIESTMAERQSMLDGAQADLRAMLDAQARRSSGSEMALFQDIMAGAGKAGVTVQPFSPAETALSYHGIPYVWGGASPSSGLDCSGLTMYVMRQHGVSLPHHAASQILLGDKVAVQDLLPGDLVFFGSPVHHVGMYIGGGYYVHAPHTGDYVKVSKLADRSDFTGARRYPWQLRVGKPMGVSGVSLPSGLPGQK